MRIHFVFLALILPTCAWAQDTVEADYCFVAPADRLCADFPHDVPEFSAFFEYMVISGAAQAPFDRHAWQAFVALNWPEIEGDGSPGWRGFPRRDVVMGSDPAATLCPAQLRDAEVVITEFTQSDGHALIDQSGNFIVYETRMNDAAARHILDNELDTLAGQSLGAVDFPQGVNAASPASVFVKTSWRILPEPSDEHIMADGLIAIPAEHSASGEVLCLDVALGLVGMHIVTKVESGNGEAWVWATFEHADNAPVAETARDINAIYGADLFPDGCVPPAADGQDFALFAAGAGTAAAANTPPDGAAFWSATPPYAVTRHGDALPPTQVVRCWDIFAPTRQTNTRWRAALNGTVLENYMLISAQWRGANPSPYIEHGELPRFLSNTTMETYLQTDRAGSCLGCHADATTAAGTPSDFTFVLREVSE